MTINNPEAFAASHWDWACLDGCFGQTRIKPTDIDGLVERNGWFLFLETKLPGVLVPQGQQITYRALLDTGKFTVVTVWGHPGDSTTIRVMTRQGADVTYQGSEATVDRLRHIVSKWFDFANAPY